MANPQAVDLDTLTDLCTPWCLHVAATLRIADHIAAGITEIRSLADAARCDADSLHALLRRLVSRGVFVEPAPGVFALNDPARELLQPGRRLSLDLDGIGGRMAYAWGTLLSYVRTGAPAYHEHFGLPFWDDLEAHPEVAASFDALMGPAGHGLPNPSFDLVDGWDVVRTVVDVGGGAGWMLAEMLRLRPHLRGTLVDLPHAIARAAETFAVAGVADRVTRLGQSFFDPLPAGHDLYLLRGVLNDWPDREALAILRRCAEAARSQSAGAETERSGRIVIHKSVWPDAEPGDSGPGALEIETVLLGGRSRSVSRFRELAREAGLEIAAAAKQPSGYFVVECRLAGQP